MQLCGYCVQLVYPCPFEEASKGARTAVFLRMDGVGSNFLA